ncbi:MAG: TrmH family RNA methyltransferase [Bradymonadia bacterium]
MARRGAMSEFCKTLSSTFIIDVLKEQCSPSRWQRMNEILDQRITSLALGLEDLNHSHNATACLRTAESLGLQDVVAIELRNEYPLPEEINMTPRTHRKLSMHAHHWIELHRLKTTETIVEWAAQRNMRILGTSPHANKTLADIEMDTPAMVLFGNEKDGLREHSMALCDETFKLPMYGFSESFNLSVCAGMVLSTLGQKRRDALAQQGLTGDLPDERKQQLLAKWLVRDIRGSELMLKRVLAELN